MPRALIVRTSAFFGEWDDANFLTRTLAALSMGRRVRSATDLIVSPTYVPDLVNAALDLLIDGESGIWHLANAGAISWADFGALAANIARVNPKRLQGCPSAELGFVARRPDYSALGSERGSLLPPLPDAIVRYAATKPWERLVRRGPRESVAFKPASPDSLTATGAHSEPA
jgi:dTDP-4-dehydrorhamnose reductase